MRGAINCNLQRSEDDVLKVSLIDRVVLRRSIPSFEIYGKLEHGLDDIADLAGSSVVLFKKGDMAGRHVWISLDARRVRVRLFKSFGVPYIDYAFGGETDLGLFDAYTFALEEWGLAASLAYGWVDRLELAFDVPGLHTSELLTHLVGVKTSQVMANQTGSGFSYYSGKPKETVQLIAYDKSEQLSDVGLEPRWPSCVRVELRFSDASRTLAELYDLILLKDPFARLRFVRIKDAMAQKTSIPNWMPFLQASKHFGVAAALQAFPHQKKTFLSYLEQSSLHSFLPQAHSYLGAMQRTLPAALVVPALQAP